MVNQAASSTLPEDESPQSAASSPTRPSDWPGDGPIDLECHDPPHESSTLEWWYVNSHLVLEDGRRACVFAAFFRQLAASGDDERGRRRYTHSVAWGLSLPDAQSHFSKVAVDSLAPRVGLENLDAGVRADDERVERALRDMLRKGRVPRPTRMFAEEPDVASDGLRLDYAGDRFEKLGGRDYRLRLFDEATGTSVDITITLEKAACRYGHDGVVHGVSGETMFYYFVPRARVDGWVRLDGRRLSVSRGTAWYDHEFGVAPAALPPPPAGGVGDPESWRRPKNVAHPAPRNGGRESCGERGETCWRWLSIQLEDQRELSVFFITRRATGEVLDRWSMLVNRDGETLAFDDTELEAFATWRSTRTFVEYPIAFRVRVPSAGVALTARATFPDQEVISVISDPAFWEGTVDVVGHIDARPVAGQGWLECKGFGHATLDDFYASVGREVRSRLAEALPTRPDDAESVSHLMLRGRPGCDERRLLDVDGRRLAAALVQPIREIADRGGKGWRSYAALACIDLVGGDSRRFLHWLIMPEIVHVGSLIVDDVEDESSVRRGGKACHLLWGVPTSVNSGTAAYFLAEPPLDRDALPAEAKLRIYRLYFDAMRAGHAGQALDLCDASDLVRAAVEAGDTRELERHVLSVHRLKTALPAAMFARVGAILGGGTDPQVECVGRFFEAVGLAFQIVDDVLNVSGFERDLKERGEDVRMGKITLPVVKALSRLEPPRRRWLWETLSSSPRDDHVVAEVCLLLADCGALSDCRTLARRAVEDAWQDLDEAVEDSQFKLMFRAFSWYVLERHY